MSNLQAPAPLAKAGASASLEAAHISSLEELERIARTLRRDIITMIGRAASGHPGGSLSTVEILTSLYFGTMRHHPADPQWTDRDRFIISNGHGAPALYAALAEATHQPTSPVTSKAKGSFYGADRGLLGEGLGPGANRKRVEESLN